MGPIIYRGHEPELEFEPIMLNGRDGALELIDHGSGDLDMDVEPDDLATFEDLATAAAWIADLLRAARAAGIGIPLLTPEEAQFAASVIEEAFVGEYDRSRLRSLHELAVRLGADLPPFEDEEADE